jgi:protein-L-isoaspartate(D-aspartate) O-methyltransferase
MRSAAEEAHHRLIDQIIARGALWSAPLTEAFRATPRHRFLDRVFHYTRQHGWRAVEARQPGRAELRLLYSDRALTTRLSEPAEGRPAVPISSSSQPSLMAQMLEDLRLAAGLRTLEIGSGTGYNAALLARVVGRVVSVEVDRRVLAEAEEHLRRFPDRAVEFRHADGRLGLPAEAPFDRIMVTAATPDLEPAWLEQLAPAGLVQAPLELTPGLAYLVQGTWTGGCFEGRLTRPAYFMPLRAEGESGRADGSGTSARLPGPEALHAVPAPWADWAERRASAGGTGLLSALAFLGWLQGLAVSFQTFPDGRPAYGVGDLVQGHACWLGTREWRVTGPAGHDLGGRLWQTFLDAGGPWPTEFRLRALPLSRGAAGHPPAAAGARLAFRRQGPRCLQVWELLEPRTRPVSP